MGTGRVGEKRTWWRWRCRLDFVGVGIAEIEVLQEVVDSCRGLVGRLLVEEGLGMEGVGAMVEHALGKA